MPIITKIELTEEDAKLFIEFQKRYIFMNLMNSIGAFNVKNGSVTVHFDNMGNIATIDKNERYRLP